VEIKFATNVFLTLILNQLTEELHAPAILTSDNGREGHAVAQLVEALRYKSEGRGFDSRWCYWLFSLT
jgi:hypothetical protein